jgi:hypothetical protein
MSWKPVEGVRSGVKWAVAFAGVYSAYVVLLAIVKGSTTFESQHTTLLKVLAVYWGGGVAAGVVVGLFLPIGQHPVGAMVLGALGGVPVFAAAMLATTPPANWGDYMILSLVGGAAVGALTGLVLYVGDRDDSSARR